MQNDGGGEKKPSLRSARIIPCRLLWGKSYDMILLLLLLPRSNAGMVMSDLEVVVLD